MSVNDNSLQQRLDEAELEIQELQNKLDETNQQMEATLNALPDLLLEVDNEGRIHSYHVDEVDTLFTTPDNFMGEKISDFLPEEAAQKFMNALHEADEHGYAVGEPYLLDTPAGLIWKEPSISIQRSEGQATGRFIARIRTVDDRMKRLAELNALAEIGKDLRRTRSSLEAGQTVVQHLEKILHLEAAALARKDAQTKEQVIVVASGEWEEATADRLAPGKGITAKVIASRESYLENEFSAEKGQGQTHLSLMSQVSALICVPLMAEDVVIGTLWLGRDKAFDENEVNLINSISETVASSIRKAQLQEETWENSNASGIVTREWRTAMSTSLVLTAELMDKIDDVLAELLSKAQASNIILADISGQLINKIGKKDNLDPTIMSALTAGTMATTTEIAKQIGEKIPSRCFSMKGKDKIFTFLVWALALCWSSSLRPVRKLAWFASTQERRPRSSSLWLKNLKIRSSPQAR